MVELLASGGLQRTAAERPHRVVSCGVKQTGDAYLGKTTKDHPAKAAVLQASMDMFGVAAAFVDGLAFFASMRARHSFRHCGSATRLRALRFGVLLTGGGLNTCTER